MDRNPLVGLAIAVATLFLIAPAGAQAKFSAKVSVTETNGPRVVVALKSTTKLTTRTRPNRVQVRSGSTVLTLTRYAGAKTGPGSWRSGKLTGTRATRARALRGKKVSVAVRSRARTTTLRPTVAKLVVPTTPITPLPGAPAPSAPAPTGPGAPAAPFPAPGRDLTGTEAIQSFGPFFFNAEFSDCAAGNWPACTVENRYGHAQDGTFVYRRCTPTVGADINFVDSYQIVGALHRADGSWVVEYTTAGGDGFYHWEVAQSGLVQGYYQFNGGAPETFRNYVWRRPANLGNCVA